MESEDDKWFVQNCTEIPMPKGKPYDHMQMSRLLSPGALWKLYEEKFFSSDSLDAIEKCFIEGGLKEFLIKLQCGYTDNSKLYQVFQEYSEDEDSLQDWGKLSRMPVTLRLFNERLIDPNLFSNM